MKLLGRVYYSLRNNLSKTIVLFSVVFILGNVICGSLAIKQSLESTQNEFRKHYGAKVEISTVDDIYSALYKNQSTNSIIRKVQKLIDKVVNESKAQYSYVDFNYYLSGMQSEMLGFMEDEEIVDVSEIHLCGVSNPYMGLVKNYKIELMEGRSFSESEMNDGSKVILISNEFYITEEGITRKVSVGDKITLIRNIGTYQEEVEYEVIGIYKRYENVMVENDRYNVDNHVARLYMPANTLFEEEKRFGELNKEYNISAYNKENTILLGEVYLQMEGIDDLGRFEKDYLKEFEDESLNGYYFYTSTNEIYKKISAPIESMSGISDFLLISSSVLCILILSVAVFILIRNRKHEIGILISLGESKFKVILQIVLEIYLVGILAMGISMVSGNKLGQFYSNYLVSEQIEQSKDNLSLDENKLQDELLENYSFELSEGYITSVMTYGTVVLLLSVIIPVGYIVRLKPRKILL